MYWILELFLLKCSMINESLHFIAGQLNAHFKTFLNISEDKFMVSNLVNADGSVPAQIENTTVICMYGCEEEIQLRNASFVRNQTGGPIMTQAPPLNLNISILICANFQSYSESLQIISEAFSFLRNQTFFDGQQINSLNHRIARLIVEHENLSVENSYQVWSMLGAKYRPALNYKIRVIGA